MTSTPLFLAGWAVLLAVTTQAHAQTSSPQISPDAEAYLSTALDTLETVMLGRDTIPWQSIRDSAFVLAAGARTPRDTYGAIDWALRHANKHSFLQASRPGAVAELIDGRIGYIHVPQRSGAAVALADSLHRAVGTLARDGACGWIVDLRGNGGGNMWPMLAGIGPLLGDTVVGYFGVGPGADRWYYRHGVSGILHPDGTLDTITEVTVAPVSLERPDVPVAVLLDGGTASSGEAVAIAFHGRRNTRTFGSPTAGFATVNRGSQLPDGANMVITTGHHADRRGLLHAEQIQPDSAIPSPPTGWPFPTDRVGTVAANWLVTRPDCQR